MPTTAPEATAPLFLQAIVMLEVLIGCALLIRHLRGAPARFLGLAPAGLTRSPYRASEIFLAAACAFGGAIVFNGVAEWLAPRFWPRPPKGEVGAYHVAVSSAFQLGLLAGLAHAWFWHLRAARRAPSTDHPAPSPALEPSPLPPLSAGAALREGVFTFFTLMPLVLLTSYLWKQLLLAIGADTTTQDLITIFRNRDDTSTLAVILIFAVLIAPLVEETIFRLGLFRWLRTRTPRSVALFLPAIVFALLHPYPVVVLPLFVFAVVIALAYERTGHPLVPIVAHALFNLNTLLLLLAGLPT